MADTFTSQELKDYKQDILEQAAAKKIYFLTAAILFPILSPGMSSKV